MEVGEKAVGAMQVYLRLKRYILPSGIAREALQAAVPFLSQPSAARELALEEAAHNLINELSGNPGELIDKMAEAIRDWGSHYDDGPWETLPEDRKAGWRGDAERALAVVKEYLTARRPSEQAVTEAMELARAVLAQSITAGHNVHGPTPEDIEEAFWALDAALKSAMEAGR